MMTLPNLFIIGAPKCGTTSLYRWLGDHPDVQTAALKETGFFADKESHIYNPERHIDGGLEGLAALYPRSDWAKKIRLEATPAHIYSATALAHIPHLPNAPKCLFVLREPAAQIHSLFTYFQHSWGQLPHGLRFSAFVERICDASQPKPVPGNELLGNAVANARYVDWLRLWRAQLGADRMRAISLEDLRKHPSGTLHAIADWVGIAPAFYDSYPFAPENRSYVTRNEHLKHAAIRLRSHLPRGPLYDAARWLYRRMNTDAAALCPDDGALVRLRREFVTANQALALEFGITFAQGEGQ